MTVLSNGSSSSESTDTESLWGQEEVRGAATYPGRGQVFSLAQLSTLQQANPEGLQTSSDEDKDYTWTPTQRSSGLLVAGKKIKKVQASQGSVKPKDSKKACPGQVKKKCVNGFIMFCRMNRKQYIRWVRVLRFSSPCAPQDHVAPLLCLPILCGRPKLQPEPSEKRKLIGFCHLQENCLQEGLVLAKSVLSLNP